MKTLFTTSCLRFLVFFALVLFSIGTYAQRPNIGAPYIKGQARVGMGIEKHDKGEYQEAIDQYKKVNPGDSAYVLAQFEMGLSLYAAKRYREALDVLFAVGDMKGNARDYQLLIANLYDDLSMADSSDWWYNKVRNQFPLHHMADYESAIARIKREKYAEALTFLYNSLQKQPFYLKSHYQIANLAAEAGQPALAMLAYHFATILQDNVDNKLEIIKLNESIASDEFKKEMKNVPEDLFGQSEAFNELNQLVSSKIALNDNFKVGIKLDFKLTRQLQLILQKLPKSTDGLNELAKEYIEFYQKAIEASSYQAVILAGLRGLNSEEITKAINKEKSSINKFVDWAGNYFLEKRKTVVLSDSNGIRKKYMTRIRKGNVAAFGEQITGEDLDGEWSFVDQNGEIESKGLYKNGKREGKWVYFSESKLMLTDVYVNGKENGPYKRYFENGIVREEGQQKDGLIDGEVKIYYPSGKLNLILNAVSGKRTGKTQRFDIEGTLVSEVQEKENLLEGKAVYYYPNGKKKSEGMNKANERVGKWVFWHKNGVKEEEGDFVNGKPNGEWTYWYSNGVKEKQISFSNGKITGIVKSWYPDGKIKYEENWKDGELNGISTFYARGGWKYAVYNYAKGVLKRMQHWKPNGNLIADVSYPADEFKVVFYDEYGQIKSEGNYNKNVAVGLWTYYEGGVKSSTVTFVNGVKEGIEKEFYSNGSVKSEYFYRNGEIDGYFRSYLPTGGPKAEGFFQNGEREGAWEYYYNHGAVDSREFYVDGKLNGADREYEVNEELAFEDWYEYGVYKGMIQYDSVGKVFNNSLLNNFSGKVRMLYPNKRVKYEANYANGSKVDEPLVHYYPDGTISRKESYKNGLREGLYEEYNRFGKLSERSWFKNGVLDSLSLDYSLYGKLLDSTQYDLGKKHGVERSFHLSGIRISESRYEWGLLQGSKRFFNEQGTVVAILEYNNDVLVGFSQIGPDGKMSDMNYVLSQTAQIRAHHPNGKLAYEFQIVNGVYSGAYKMYMMNGNLLSEYFYENGQRHGIAKDFFKNGKVMQQMNYERDDLHGAYKKYNEAGLLVENGHYYFSTLHGLIQYFNTSGKIEKQVNYRYGKLL